MRRQIIIIAAILALSACGDSTKEEALNLLGEARAHFEQGDLDAARKDIDSLRQTYPNIVEARKGALKLHQDIELKAAQDELAHTDSLLKAANQELEALQKATPEELTLLTRTRMKRDSIRTQFEALGMKIRYIHQKQSEK